MIRIKVSFIVLSNHQQGQEFRLQQIAELFESNTKDCLMRKLIKELWVNTSLCPLSFLQEFLKIFIQSLVLRFDN